VAGPLVAGGKMKLNAIIVDDEPFARETLKAALENFPDIEILAECVNGFEAVQAVQKHQPQLLFLDIQMPKLDGLDVVELLGKDAPFVIFVTSYDEYALKAFEAEALDYILKPVKAERLAKTIQRVRERMRAQQVQPMEQLIDKHRDSMGPLDRVLIRNGYDVVIIPAQEIVYFEAEDDYVKVYTAEGKSFLKSERMSKLEKMLDPRNFCRIHRSFILNIEYIKKIEPYTKDNKVAILKTGQRLSISRSGYTRLMELL